MEKVIKNSLDVDYTVQIWKEGNQFVAHTMPLDIMSCGETPEQASKALFDAVGLFLVTAEEMGTLDEVLEEAGYQHSDMKWRAPLWVAFEQHSTVIGA